MTMLARALRSRHRGVVFMPLPDAELFIQLNNKSGGILTFHLKLLHPNHFFDKTGIDISSQKVFGLHDFCLKWTYRFNTGDQAFTEPWGLSTKRPVARG